MKKYISLLLVMILAMSMLAGCGGSGSDGSDAESEGSGAASAESFKTFGDIIDSGAENMQTALYPDQNKLVYAFQIGDTYYRATADISKEDADKYMAVDYSEEDYEKQLNDIVSPIEIGNLEVLNDQILSQEDLDALAGKTGKELVEEGWMYSGTYMLEDMDIEMSYGPFAYMVRFDGKVDEKDWEDFDAEAGTADMKVISAEFSQMGDATNIEE